MVTAICQARAGAINAFSPALRQEQDFSGLRPGPEFGISRLPETGQLKPRVEKAAPTRAFLVKSRDQRFGELCGGGRSRSRTCLRWQNSLLTGKITGNFVESACLVRFCALTREQIQRLAAKFPTQRTGNYFGGTANPGAGTGNFPGQIQNHHCTAGPALWPAWTSLKNVGSGTCANHVSYFVILRMRSPLTR
jgi:hypothetical protein